MSVKAWNDEQEAEFPEKYSKLEKAKNNWVNFILQTHRAQSDTTDIVSPDEDESL